MPVLTLDYRHCDRKRPKFIKHVEIEAIAALARQQLVGSGVDAIAIDTYLTAADNLAAIAATLDAMRSIERHGGAEILDRAFTGFAALPAPDAARPWHVVLGVAAHEATDAVRMAYRRAASAAHPDKGGSDARMAEVNAAWSAFQVERGLA